MAKKFVIMCTHGPADAERATVAMAMATSALAADAEVVLGLQVDGVLLAKKGALAGVVSAKFPPLADLMTAFQESGGRLLVCAPCMMARDLDAGVLLDGSTVVGAAAFVSECLDATSVLSY